MFGLFILEFPSPFFVLDCKWSCCASLPFLLSFSSPLPGLAYLGFRMYIPELCCKTTWKEDLFLPLNCIDYSRRRALGSKCLSEDIPNTVCLFAFMYSKFGVFLAKVNGTGTKRIMNVIFFPPCYCSLHCFFFLFV